jgi:hypothetical protein
MSFKEKLAKMRDQAAAAEENYRPGFGQPIPDDDYIFQVKATLDYTKKDPKRLQVIWVFVVTEGDFMGRQVWDWTIIEDNEVGLNICHSRVDDLGYQWPEKEVIASEGLVFLEPIIEDITNRCPRVTARVRTKTQKGKDDVERERTSLYIRECHDMPEGQPAATRDAEAEQAEASSAAEEAPDNQALLDFCASQGLEGMTTDMTNEQIIQGLKEGGVTFTLATLTQEEVDLLESNGGEDLLIRKVTPPPAKKAAIIKKPAAPAPTTKKPAPIAKKGKK